MKKRPFIIGGVIIILLILFFSSLGKKANNQDLEQTVLEETYTLSVEYLSLHQETAYVLEQANSFDNYDSWLEEMKRVTKAWGDLEKDSLKLEKIAKKLTKTKVSSHFIPSVLAYTTAEINKVIDNAPYGKKIITLANYLGTDAKRAQLILNQTQNEVNREAYGEEGDVFEKCEQNATRIKNGAKVTGYVGGVVLSGGASAIIASGALATTATVVVGADLVLEITEDEARIALGDKNQVSEFASNIRIVTEPAAAILTLTNIPGNLSKGIDKLSALSFGADQVRSVIQDEKVLGISIKVNQDGELITEAVGMSEDELPAWKESNGITDSNESVKEIIEQSQSNIEKMITEKEDEKKSVKNDKDEKEAIETNESVPLGNREPIPFNEYDEMDERGLFKNITSIIEHLGEPDLETTNDNGRMVYMYFDVIKYESGNLAGLRFSFYNEEDYRRFIENMGASWETNKENWDVSGGGITATTQVISASAY